MVKSLHLINLESMRKYTPVSILEIGMGYLSNSYRSHWGLIGLACRLLTSIWPILIVAIGSAFLPICPDNSSTLVLACNATDFSEAVASESTMHRLRILR